MQQQSSKVITLENASQPTRVVTPAARSAAPPMVPAGECNLSPRNLSNDFLDMGSANNKISEPAMPMACAVLHPDTDKSMKYVDIEPLWRKGMGNNDKKTNRGQYKNACITRYSKNIPLHSSENKCEYDNMATKYGVLKIPKTKTKRSTQKTNKKYIKNTKDTSILLARHTSLRRPASSNDGSVKNNMKVKMRSRSFFAAYSHRVNLKTGNKSQLTYRRIGTDKNMLTI
jgi:hypothetical protein